VNYKKIITIPVYRRPNYTKQVLEGLRNCYGIKDYTICIFAEPGYPEVIDVIKSFTDLNIILTINEKQLGLPSNTRQCLDYGFSVSDFVIHIEDDTVPDKDCLEFYEWVRDEYENDKEIYTITAYNRCEPIPNDHDIYHEVRRRPWFHSTSWATWQDRWEEIKNGWVQVELINVWSNSVQNTRGNRCEIYPCIARVKYIGKELSTNTLTLEYFNEFWVGSVELEKGKYYEVGKNHNK
jgi:hypothetical protein